jgi:hypothetical protein
VFCSASAPAVRNDPQYTEAWASLSANLAFHGAAFEERIAKARDAAAKMIGLAAFSHRGSSKKPPFMA